MNLDELRPILHAYRAQVQQAWSPATAHEGYEGRSGDPAGQCGVTSAWLQRRLLEDHGIEAAFAGGFVWLGDECVGDNHCWLEVGAGPERIVIDLTVGQMPGISDLPVLYATQAEMRRSGIYYNAHRHPTSDDLIGPLGARLAVLTEALS